jgi:hypothetical protein
MNNWKAPIAVAIVTTVAAVLVQEPGAALLGYALAGIGYYLNKEGN